MNYSLPAQILTVHKKSIVVMPFKNTAGCRRCAEGNGCGNHPWFFGIHENKPLVLPITTPKFQCRDNVEIILNTRGINLAAFVSYGIPLAGFVLTLLITQRFAEILQLLLAVVIGCITAVITRPIQRHILIRYLTVQHISEKTPYRYFPLSSQ